MKHNDLDMQNWKELDINTDSLWIINQRDKSGNTKMFTMVILYLKSQTN